MSSFKIPTALTVLKMAMQHNALRRVLVITVPITYNEYESLKCAIFSLKDVKSLEGAKILDVLK